VSTVVGALVGALVAGIAAILVGMFTTRSTAASAYHSELRADNEGYRRRMDAQDRELTSLRARFERVSAELAQVGSELARITDILHEVQLYARSLEDRMKIPHRRWNDAHRDAP
jgi:chromosome segregation ATPase